MSSLPKTTAQEEKRLGAQTANSGKSSPLLSKIQATIAQSDPEKWDRYGDKLNETQKYQKPREAWERIFCISIPNGILAFRSSQPVQAEYFGGGYSLSPIAPERYFVELRPRAWDPRTLVDPYYRSALEKDRQFQLIADGEIARTVFIQIENTVSSFNGEKRKELRAKVEALAKNIIERAQATEANDWKKTQPEHETTEYQAVLDDVSVVVTKAKKNGLETFRLVFTKEDFCIKSAEAQLSKSLYYLIQEKEEFAALQALSKVFDDAGW